MIRISTCLLLLLSVLAVGGFGGQPPDADRSCYAGDLDALAGDLDAPAGDLDALAPELDAAATDLDALAGDLDAPTYYAIRLVTTKKVAGARMARGIADVTFRPSPFGVSVTPGGSYAYDLHIRIERLRAPSDGHYVVWATTPNLDNVVRLGVLDESFQLRGSVEFNKFLVVVSLESEDNADQDRWAGPIVLRGMSRSGKMHTMAGHGPFQTEPCAIYGY